MTEDPVSLAEGVLKCRFHDGSILRSALTHGSFSEESGAGSDYQLLEFLGDAVLELVTREYLISRFPLESEGELTRRKIRIVQKSYLADQGMRLGLDGIALVGASFVRTREAARSLAADLLESVIGALYADGGLERARSFVLREILERASFSSSGPDARSRLQEHCQSKGMKLPEYRLISRDGPDHDPVFRVAVIIEGHEMGLGVGHTRKAAREEAAGKALESIERMV